MGKVNSSKYKTIWLFVLILIIFVGISSFVLTSRLNVFLLDDNGAISLVSETASTVTEKMPENESVLTPSTETMTPQVSIQPGNAGFEVSDEQTVWNTATEIEIFKVSYLNGEKVVTLNSDNGESVIAPGTENSYTFKLKNTGDVAVDYTVAVEAYFTPEEIELPIIGRLNRYDSKWLVGDLQNYEEILALNGVEDSATLGAGKYTYYTLDWLWSYESGNDELDTMLGNMAVDEELALTIVISTIATASDDPNDDSGITPPQTGDDSKITLWISIAIGSLILIVILILYQIREKRRVIVEARSSEKR